MNKLEHLLVTFSEECSEIAQATSKALRFGIDEPEENIRRYTNEDKGNNRERISREVSDMKAIMELLEEAGVPEIMAGLTNRERIERKKTKVRYFLKYAKGQGTLQ